MATLIDVLESRTLLSTTVPLAATSVEQAVTALRTEANQARLDVAAFGKTEAADLRAVKSDLKRLKSNPANAKLLKEYTQEDKNAYNLLKKDATAVANSLSKTTKQDIADGIKFILNPGNAKVTAKLAADLKALQTLTTRGPVAKLISDAKSSGTLLTTQLNAISAANSGDVKTVADVDAANSNLTTGSAKLQGDASVLQTDLDTLVSAVEVVENL